MVATCLTRCAISVFISPISAADFVALSISRTLRAAYHVAPSTNESAPEHAKISGRSTVICMGLCQTSEA